MIEPVVLVVDDEPNVVRLCRRLLERDGFQVLSATSPSQALGILSLQRVDLLLVDVRMPGLDGFQLISLARNHQPNLATVIMTGYGTVDTAVSALQQGADGLILKPFDAADFVQGVRRALQESQQKQDGARLRALRPLFDLTEQLLAERTPDKLAEMVVNSISTHLRCSFVGLYLYVQDDHTFHLLSGNDPALPCPITGEYGKAFSQAIVHHRHLMVHANGQDEAGVKPFLAENGLDSLVFTSTAHGPDDQYLLAGRKVGEGKFSASDLEMFLILARQSGTVMDNARLYEELRAYIDQVEKSQQAMIQAEKMAAAGRLTASIAHEINNPLQSLHNCLHLAGRTELSFEDRQKYLIMAQNELDRLMHTVQQMLDFYRPGARDRQANHVNDLVSHVVRLMEPQLHKQGIRVELSLSGSLPPVMVVGSQIQQVLINLIINSMEAMPGGGVIFIETLAGDGSDFNIRPKPRSVRKTGRLVLPSNAGKKGVIIRISDTGPGIPESERERIFEPFVSTKENGTGLGLAVSYNIVAAHGGILSMDKNSRGQGACFRIILPEEKII